MPRLNQRFSRGIFTFMNGLLVSIVSIFVISLLPFLKFLLPLLTVVERKDIREQAASDLFDFVFGDIGFIDEFLFSGQADLHEDLSCVSTCTPLVDGPPVLFESAVRGIEKAPPFCWNNMCSSVEIAVDHAQCFPAGGIVVLSCLFGHVFHILTHAIELG